MRRDIVQNKTFLPEEDGTRWQIAAAEFVESLVPTVVVETGIHTGLSTSLILRALDRNKKGQLHSVDPTPRCRLEHHRWSLWPMISLYALPQIYHDHGAFDVFIHDSDHDAECQTFEYEFAWRCLVPGGLLISDDVTWGGHGAWDQFVRRHNLKNVKELGHARAVKRPAWETPLAVNEIFEFAENCHAFSVQVAREAGQEPRYAWQDPNYFGIF